MLLSFLKIIIRLPPRYHVVFLDMMEAIPTKRYEFDATNQTVIKQQRQPDASSPYLASLAANERVTAKDHFQDVRLLTFDIADSGIRYTRFKCRLSGTYFVQLYSVVSGTFYSCTVWSQHTVQCGLSGTLCTVYSVVSQTYICLSGAYFVQCFNSAATIIDH